MTEEGSYPPDHLQALSIARPSVTLRGSGTYQGKFKCGDGGRSSRSTRSWRRTSRSARTASPWASAGSCEHPQRRKVGHGSSRRCARRPGSIGAGGLQPFPARAAAERSRRSFNSARARSSRGPTSRQPGPSNRLACPAQAKARQRSPSRGDVHTPVTTGAPSHLPHCPASTWTEYAQPLVDGLNGSGSRSLERAVGRSGTAGSPGAAVVRPRGGSAHVQHRTIESDGLDVSCVFYATPRSGTSTGYRR